MRALLLIYILFFLSSLAYGSPSSFVLQGQIIQPNGQTLEENNVTFTLQILSTTNECLLHEETSTINMTNSNGVFSLSLGNGTNTGAGGLADLSTALDNSLGNQTGLTCASGSDYDPNGGDTRKLRVTFDHGTGPTTLAQDHVIESVPYAQYAGKLGGKSATEFIQVNSTTAGVTQANLETVFDNAANQAELLALIGGTSSNYSQASANGAGSLPGFTTAAPPAAPSAGDIWFDTDTGQVLYYDGSSTQPVGSGGSGTVTSVATGSGLTGGAITTTGTISVATGGILNTHLASGIDASKITTGTLPAGVVPTGTDNTKLALAGGTMTGDITMGGNQVLGAGHITQATQSTITIGAYTNAEEATLVGSLGGANAGATWYNSDSGDIKYWDGTAASVLNTSSASVTGSHSNGPISIKWGCHT